MADYDRPPSEVLTPDQLDQALLTLVVRRDGTAVTWVSSDADRDAVAAYLVEAAAQIRVAPVDCSACREGLQHTHDGE